MFEEGKILQSNDIHPHPKEDEVFCMFLDKETLRKETNRVFELNRRRVNAIIKLEEEFQNKIKRGA